MPSEHISIHLFLISRLMNKRCFYFTFEECVFSFTPSLFYVNLNWDHIGVADTVIYPIACNLLSSGDEP